MTEKSPPPPEQRDSPRLSRSVQAEIGRRLQQFYDGLKCEEEPIPARFAEIIDRYGRAAAGESKA
jgi:hypothetical protein